MAHLEFTRQESNTFVLKINSLIKNEDLVTVFQKMFRKLKYNHIEGIKLMWNAGFKINSKAGCVLAHSWASGKAYRW